MRFFHSLDLERPIQLAWLFMLILQVSGDCISQYCVFFLFIIITWKYLPETKNKSLIQIYVEIDSRSGKSEGKDEVKNKQEEVIDKKLKMGEEKMNKQEKVKKTINYYSRKFCL